MIGEVVGNFRIVSQLGKGGMGVVYRAEHVQLGRPVALKMLQPQFTNDAVVVQRFFNEARAASAIDHPGIVEVYDFGVHTDGRAYLAMALLKGETLTAVMERGWIPPRDAAAIIEQVANALAAAHAAGIVHRDLKPDNIVLVPNELVAGGVQAKLLDFGIAKLADQKDAGFKTETGYVIGTPLYMSPEQCMGAPEIDHRTDLYSLGCILYHLLTGKPPFEHEWAGAILAAQLRDQPADPRTFVSDIPDDLVRITMRLLEKNPAARFQSATELRDALAPAPYPAMSQRASVQYPVARAAPTTATGAAAQLVSRVEPTAIDPPPRRAARIGVAAFVVTLVAAVGLSSRSSERLAPAPRAAAARAVTIVEPAVAPPTPPPPTSKPPATKRKRSETPPPPAAPPTTPAPAPVPRARFTLAESHYAPHARMVVRFPVQITSTPSARRWLTIAEAGGQPPPYETWLLVENGARGASLQAPATPGTYEARLYSNDLELQSTVRFVVDSDATGNSQPSSKETDVSN